MASLLNLLWKDKPDAVKLLLWCEDEYVDEVVLEATAATARSDVTRSCLATNPNPRCAKFIFLYAMVIDIFAVLKLKGMGLLSL